MPRLDGTGEHDAVDQRPGELVEHEQLPAPRRDREPLVAELGVDGVGAQAGGVDHEPRAHGGAVSGVQRGVLLGDLDAVDGVVQQQVGAAPAGVGGQCEVRGPGADDRLVGDGERAERTRPEGGQLAVHLGGVDDQRVVIAVLAGLVLQGGQRVELFLVPRDEQRAGAFDRDPGLSGVGAQQVIAATHEPALQGAGRGVEAGVQDGGVGLAGAVADVDAGLEQRDRQLVAGQLSRDC